VFFSWNEFERKRVKFERNPAEFAFLRATRVCDGPGGGFVVLGRRLELCFRHQLRPICFRALVVVCYPADDCASQWSLCTQQFGPEGDSLQIHSWAIVSKVTPRVFLHSFMLGRGFVCVVSCISCFEP
jgi:hypothetical protein